MFKEKSLGFRVARFRVYGAFTVYLDPGKPPALELELPASRLGLIV